MNTSRFEVPLTLPPPHFDDERTIATARQVEPIGPARAAQSWRKLRTLLPVLLLATLCGALGAAAVNYYERKSNAQAPAVQQASSNTTAPTQAKAETMPVAIAASADNQSKAKADESATVEKKDSPEINDERVKPEPEAVRAAPEAKTEKAEKKKSDVDATKLTRKRRVQPVDEPPRDKSGAARIADIFGGPNP